MSEQHAERQVCSHCRSPQTAYAGTVGHRQVWRCHACGRTFWPKKKGSSVFRRIKNIFTGQSGQ